MCVSMCVSGMWIRIEKGALVSSRHKLWLEKLIGISVVGRVVFDAVLDLWGSISSGGYRRNHSKEG